MSKNTVFQALLDSLSGEIAKSTGVGSKRSDAHNKKTCAKCGGDATKFRDELSKKEYTLTAWCQSCQDAFFGT